MAWAHVTIPEVALSGDTVDDWYPLNGKLGEGKEGMINVIFSFTVSLSNTLHVSYKNSVLVILVTGVIQE